MNAYSPRNAQANAEETRYITRVAAVIKSVARNRFSVLRIVVDLAVTAKKATREHLKVEATASQKITAHEINAVQTKNINAAAKNTVTSYPLPASDASLPVTAKTATRDRLEEEFALKKAPVSVLDR